MKIIDAHTHVFETLKGFGCKGELRAIGRGEARWANGEIIKMLPKELGDKECSGERVREFLLTKGVERAVLLQGSFYGFQNEYVYEMISKYPDFYLGAGTFDPFCKNADEIYERLTTVLGFRVIKFETSSGGGLMSYHKDFSVYDTFKKIAQKMDQARQTLVIDIGSPGMASFQTEDVKKLALAYPGLKIVVCHLLAPTLKDEAELEQALKLLALDNIWMDLAAIPWNVYPETYPYRTGVKYIELAKKYIGTDKIIWGSDLPSPLTRESYENLYTYIIEAGIFTEEELEKVFYKNCLEAYPFHN